MPISIDWGTKVISVPQSYLTHIAGVYYEMDVDQFRLDLKDLEDSVEGMPFLDTHEHFPDVTVGGVTLAPVVRIINGYTVTFENGAYSVTLKAANNNILDALNFNNVSVSSTNSAGLQVYTSGSGVTEQDKLDIADRVLDETLAGHTTTDTVGDALRKARQMSVGRWKFNDTTKTLTFYESDGVTPMVVFDMKDDVGNPTLEGIYERVPQ